MPRTTVYSLSAQQRQVLQPFLAQLIGAEAQAERVNEAVANQRLTVRSLFALVHPALLEDAALQIDLKTGDVYRED